MAGWLGDRWRGQGPTVYEHGMPRLVSEALFGLVRLTRIETGQHAEAGRALGASRHALKPGVRALGCRLIVRMGSS